MPEVTRDELLARHQYIEWSDIEFKEAAWADPKSALEGGILRMTVPDKTTSPAQRYALTETAIKLKRLHEQQIADAKQGGEDNGY